MKQMTTRTLSWGLLLVGSGLFLGMSTLTGGIATAAAEKSLANDGATLLDTRCSVCHSADRPKRARKSLSQWETTVTRMIGKGAQLSAAEKGMLVSHLAKTYGE